MIIDDLKNIELYEYIPNFKKVIKFIKENDITAIENGKYDLGDNCRVAVSEYNTKEEDDIIKLEAHRNFLDVQLTSSGEEVLYFQARDLGDESVSYDEKKDVEFFETEWNNELVLNGKNFAIIFPNDLHAGGFVCNEVQKVKKLVFKLKLED